MYVSQECIPVGCVPAARRPYSGVSYRGGVYLVWGGLPGPGGVCLVPGGGLPGPKGGSAWSQGGGVCLVRGGSAWSWGGGLVSAWLVGGWCLLGGVCLVRGGGIPACTEADHLPP